MNACLTAKALEDIESCLFWSAENLGIPAAHRYRVLLETALLAIIENPELPGSIRIEGLDGEAGGYHMRHSRKQASVGGLIVKNPRPFLVYRATDGGSIEILRVLHERMDFESNFDP